MFKTLLDSQKQAYLSAIEVIKDQFNARVAALETRVSELTTSLEFTQAEVVELKGQVKALEKEKKNYDSAMNVANSERQDLQNRCNYLDDYSRRHNLRITGVGEQVHEETWEQTASKVQTLLNEKLELPSVALERAHRVGRVQESRPRPIVVRFERFCDREAALRNARKLKGTGIYLNEDLCAASQAIKQSQMPMLRAARSEGKVAFFRHTRLVVKDRGAAVEKRPGGGGAVAEVPAGGGGAVASQAGRSGDTPGRDGALVQACAVARAPSGGERQGDGAVLPSGAAGPAAPGPGGVEAWPRLGAQERRGTQKTPTNTQRKESLRSRKH